MTVENRIASNVIVQVAGTRRSVRGLEITSGQTVSLDVPVGNATANGRLSDRVDPARDAVERAPAREVGDGGSNRRRSPIGPATRIPIGYARRSMPRTLSKSLSKEAIVCVPRSCITTTDTASAKESAPS